MIYLVLFFSLFLAAFNWNRLKPANQKRLFYICLIILIAFSGFRARTVGIDTTGGYYYQYLYAKAGYSLSYVEPGWRLLNKMIVKMNLNYSGVLISASLMTLLPVAYVIRRKCDNPCFGLSVYYGMCMILYSFNLMRQCIAIAWLFLSIYLFEKRLYLPMLVTFLVAVSFHTSALLFFLIPLFSVINLKYETAVFFCVSSFLVGLTFSEKTAILSLILGKYAGYLDSTNGYNGFRNDLFLPLIFALVVNLFFLALFFLRMDRPMGDIWYKTTILGLIMMNITLRFGQGTRIVLYFSQAQAITVPFYIRSLHNRQNKRLVYGLYFSFLLINFIRILLSQRSSLLPYRTFWMN